MRFGRVVDNVKSPIKRRSTGAALILDSLCLVAVVAFVIVSAIGAFRLATKTTRHPYVPPVAKSWSEVPYPDDEPDEIERLEAGEEPDPRIAQGLPSRAEWQYQFSKARKKLLETHPICQACGRGPEEQGSMNAHHIVSVKRIETEGLPRTLLTDLDNLIILCRDCHHHLGHPHGWTDSNPMVQHDVKQAWHGCQNVTYQQAVAAWRRANTPAKTTVAP